MKAGAVPRGIVIAGAERVSVKVAWGSVGTLVSVLAGWSVDVLAFVSVGAGVEVLVAIAAFGPKGVNVGEGSWLEVTVGPTTAA